MAFDIDKYAATSVNVKWDDLDLETFHRDRSRQNWLSLLGWTFLRFTGRHLRNEPRKVASQIATALGLEF